MEGPCCSGDGDKNVRSRRAHRVWCLGQGSSSAAPGSSTWLCCRRAESSSLRQRHGWERRALALSWDTGCSTHCQMKLLLEFPASFPLSSSQLRRLMAVCLSKEGWCYTELGLRTMGRIPGGHKQISSGARVTKRFIPHRDGP